MITVRAHMQHYRNNEDVELHTNFADEDMEVNSEVLNAKYTLHIHIPYPFMFIHVCLSTLMHNFCRGLNVLLVAALALAESGES